MKFGVLVAGSSGSLCISMGLCSLVTTPFLPERPGIYCLRMRVIRARVVHHIMRNDVYGRAWL